MIRYFCRPKFKNDFMKHCCWVLALFLIACSGEKNLEPYYFPHQELSEGKVYEYHAPDPADSLVPPFYMYYLTERNDTAVFLTSMNYDPYFQPSVFTRERVVSSGVLLESMYLYETDTTGTSKRVDAQVLHDNVFAFRTDPEQPGVLVWEARWNPPAEVPTTMTLLRNRQYVKDTIVTVDGQPTDGIVVKVIERIDQEQVGHFEQEYTGTEVYAEGIGLVYYRKDITPEFKVEYALKERYSMAELEAKAK